MQQLQSEPALIVFHTLCSVSLLEHKHPSTLAFAFASVIVGHESGKMLAFAVNHLVCLNVRVAFDFSPMMQKLEQVPQFVRW